MLNFVKQSQATLIFITWLAEVEKALGDKKLTDEEIVELILGLIPVLQLYGLQIDPGLKSETAKKIYEKVQAISTLSSALQTAANIGSQTMID